MKLFGKSKVLIVFSMLLIIIASGCSSNKKAVWTRGKPFAKESVKIGMILTDNAEIGWGLSHVDGLKKAALALGLKDEQMIIKYNISDADQALVESSMADLIAEGANIIIATGSRYMEPCNEMATKHPNIVFAIAAANKRNETNFANFYGSVYQARYLAGVLAGLKTETGKLGVVALTDGGSSTNSFAIGIESVNPEAQVYVALTNGWYDPEAEKLAVRKLIDAGCDLIVSNVNTSVAQIEVEKAGLWAIGHHSDMLNEAPEAILTSVAWNWSVYYEYLLNSVIDGSFKTDTYNSGIEEGLVDLLPLNEALTTPEMKAVVEAERARILSGEIGVFDGLLETNTGEIIGTEGETLPSDKIQSGMTWYYRNITKIE